MKKPIASDVTQHQVEYPATSDQCGDEFIPADSARQVEDLVKKSQEDGGRSGFVQFSKAA